MTQDDWVGKYWIWKEQLKVAIITVDIVVLCAQTLVEITTTCPKYPFKFPVTVPPVTCLAQLKWEKKNPWPIERSMSGPPTRAKISDKMPGNKQILESSVELNWHYTDLLEIWPLLFSCFWSFNIQIPRLFGDVDHLVGSFSIFLFTRTSWHMFRSCVIKLSIIQT